MERREQQLLARFYRSARDGEPAVTAAVLATGALHRRSTCILIVVVVVLLVASAVLALAETSLVRTSRAKALSLVDEGRRGARVAGPADREPPGLPQPGAPARAHLPAGGGHPGRHPGLGLVRRLGVVAATVFEIVVIFVLGEAVPEELGRPPPGAGRPVQRAPRLGAGAASGRSGCVSGGADRPGQPADRGRGAAYLGSDVTESELLAMADVAVEDDVIETEERALIHSIIEFGDTVVREVMVPRPDMCAVDADATVEAALDAGPRGGLQPAAGGRAAASTTWSGSPTPRTSIRAGAGRPRAREPVRDHVRAAHFVPRDQAGLRPDARDAGARSSTWPSWSTSTAARPAW